ncbi:MAG: hypothetical protein KBA55_10820 [Ruminococcus sp.]|nr:hypothetical protein [Ruminococcus sp.]
MKTYIYPENLRATVKLWFWNVRDFIIICTGVVISVMIFAKLWTPVPMAFTICYAFITLRAEDTAIMDYMTSAFRYFCITQREYRWKKGK